MPTLIIQTKVRQEFRVLVFKQISQGQYSSEVIGFYANINNDGNVSGTYGAKLNILGSGSTNGSSVIGLQTNVKGTGTPSNRYGIYSDVNGYTWNNAYGIYSRSQVTSHPNVGNGLNAYGGYFIATGASSGQFGIYASCDAPNQVQTNRYAGYFAGNVAVVGTLSKSSGTFKIDHPQDPENKYLYHSFVESPDMLNVYNGNITTDANGEATVSLPNYFEALNINFRYQLTPIGQYSQVFVAEKVKNNQFKIKSDKSNVEISWQVTGIMKRPLRTKKQSCRGG